MFFIWRGWGALVALITFAILVLLNYILDDVAGNGYYENHIWVVGLGLLISCPIIWFIGKKLNDKFRGKTFTDNESGKVFKYRTRHTFFFIPMDYCGLILGGVGVIVIIAGLLK